MNTPIADALAVLITEGLVKDTDTELSAVTRIKSDYLSTEKAAEIVAKITPEDSYAENFIQKGDAACERQVYNQYLLAYMASFLIKNKFNDSSSVARDVYLDAVEKANLMTNERLYGSMQWLGDFFDSQQALMKAAKANDPVSQRQTKAIKPRGSKMEGETQATSVAEVAAPAVAAPAAKRDRVKQINARCVEMRKAGAERAAILAALASEFGITKPITAVTYLNGALQVAGLQFSPRKPKAAVATPVVAHSMVETVQAEASV